MNKTTIMHKAIITQDIRGSPQRGATSTNSSSFYYLLSSFLQAPSIKTLLRGGQGICAHLARSSFPGLGYNTKPSIVCAQSTIDNQHTLSTEPLTTLALSTSIYNNLLSPHHHPHLLTSPSYLFIHYKRASTWVNPWADIPIPVT
jgi:hypothetical protein